MKETKFKDWEARKVCGHCESKNIYFDSHAGLVMCRDCGWDSFDENSCMKIVSKSEKSENAPVYVEIKEHKV